jgi:hypothetical protein
MGISRRTGLIILFTLATAGNSAAGGPHAALSTSVINLSPKYVGTNNTQARLSFDARIDLPLVSATSPLPEKTVIHSKISTQLAYLLGPFHQSKLASALGDQEITLLSTDKLRALKTVQVKYHYEGTILLNAQLREENGYEIILPLRIDGLYTKQRKDGKSLCVDGADTGANYFFYHWNPHAAGCNLTEGTDFQRLHATFKRVANTSRTYPEYSRMVDPSGVIDVRVFFGKANYDLPIADPRKETALDWGAYDFTAFTNRLQQRGFTQQVWPTSQVRTVAPHGELPVVENYTKTFGPRTLRVTVFFGETGLLHSSSAFHRFWENAVENASVVVYSGHAGVGKNLSLPRIEKAEGRALDLPKDKYQLLVLNACVSYSYYPRMYFERKKTPESPTGSKNLDILTNGAESLFGSTAIYSEAVLRMIEDWARGARTWSYQELAAQGREDFLYGIMGDEDNPTAP